MESVIIKLYNAVNNLVQNKFDSPETWKSYLQSEPLEDSKYSVDLFYDLLDKNVCKEIVSVSSQSHITAHNVAITAYINLFGKYKLSNEQRKYIHFAYIKTSGAFRKTQKNPKAGF